MSTAEWSEETFPPSSIYLTNDSTHCDSRSHVVTGPSGLHVDLLAEKAKWWTYRGLSIQLRLFHDLFKTPCNGTDRNSFRLNVLAVSQTKNVFTLLTKVSLLIQHGCEVKDFLFNSMMFHSFKQGAKSKDGCAKGPNLSIFQPFHDLCCIERKEKFYQSIEETKWRHFL